MAKPLYVAISTQKGGAGKTTLTAILASYLYYEKGVDLVALDCDYPQYSLSDLRERDFVLAEKSKKVNELVFATWKKFNHSSYPIEKSTPEDALAMADMFVEQENPPRIIFFDLPGTVNNVHVINTLSKMDYIFCPLTTDPMVIETSVNFANSVQNGIVTTNQSNIKGMYMFWNKVPSRERNSLQALVEKFIYRLGIDILETVLPDSTKFRKEGTEAKKFSVFRSTILPPDRNSLKGSGVQEICDEISRIMGI